MADRYDSLQPPHVISTLRSMPRRWKSALQVPPPKSIDDVFTEPAGDLGTAAEHSGAALAMLVVLGDAIRTTSYNTPEPLGPEANAARTNAGTGPWPESADAAITEIGETCEALADRLDALSSSDWMRSADGVTINDLARGAARVAAERLRHVELVVDRLS